MKRALLGLAIIVFLASVASANEIETYYGYEANDSAWWSGTTLYRGGTTVAAMCQNGASNRGTVVFRNILIPPDSTIVSATVTVTAAASENTDPAPATVIYLWNGDDASMCDTRANCETAYGTKTAGTTWTNPVDVVNGTEYTSPNFKTDLQSIIDREGWATGNNIQLFFATCTTANRMADGFGQYSGHPVLNVEWTPPGGWVRKYERFVPSAQEDDGYARYNPNCGSWTKSNSAASFGLEYQGWVRFSDVTIPKGSTITSAIFSGMSDAAISANSDFAFYGHDADTGGTSANCGELDALLAATTTAAVSCQVPDAVALRNRLPDMEVKTIVQEIVDRAGWASGNDITLLNLIAGDSGAVEGWRSWDSLSGADDMDSPWLLVFWEPPVASGYPHDIGGTSSASVGQFGDVDIEDIAKIGGTE